MDNRLMISTGIAALILGLLLLGFLINAYGQVSGQYAYTIPAEIVHLCELVIGPALMFLTIGGIAEIRRRGKSNEENTPEPDDIVLLPDDGYSTGARQPGYTDTSKDCEGAAKDR